MAANDEFPRGLTLSTFNSNPASVVFPAVPGIAWVLTDIKAQLWVGGTSSGQGEIQTSLGTSGPTGMLHLDGSITNDVDTWEWSGKVIALPGSALTVQFAAAVSPGTENIVASAYPI